MLLFRIAKSEKRAKDLSGTGAFKEGGRWNSPGNYMLYTSENSSLAYLENLVHFEAENTPPNLYITSIVLSARPALIYTLPDNAYPENWQEIGCLEIKALGDQLTDQRKYIAIKVRSAVNKFEYNYLLNPLFPGYHDQVKVSSVEKLTVDARLAK
jgi:RES domain-containing protein